MRITITPVGLQSVRGFQGQAGSAGVNVNVMNVVYTFRKEGPPDFCTYEN